MSKLNSLKKTIAGCLTFALSIVAISNVSLAFNVVELDSKHDFAYGTSAGIFSAIEDIFTDSTSQDSVETTPVLEVIASIEDVNVTSDSNEGQRSVVTEISPIEAKPEISEEISEENIENSEDVDDEWSTKLMADVEDKLNVRTEPSEEAELAGKIRRGDLAEIIEVTDEWIKISSGNLEGYVSAEYCVTGSQAKNLADEVCKQYADVQVDGLRIRKEPNEDASIVDMLSEDDSVLVNTEADEVEGWVAVSFDGKEGYVNDEYVEVAVKYGEAITIEEERAQIAAAKAEEAKKSLNRTNPSMAAGADEVTLLAAIIQCEAGRSGYEGQLAVGAVVCNRVRRGYGGGSISGVIYQPGQFPPATNGIMAGVLASGVSGSCIQAAQAALAGADNTGGAVNFRSAKSGYGGTVIGGNVFF